MNNQLDPQVVNLAKAIRQTESGGDFQAKGKSGEFGAYQFTEPTWKTYASQYGINVNLQDATPEQQNEVVYKKIKEWKDKGHNVGEIASMWNAGESKKDAYLTGHKGVNDLGVEYDTGKYAEKVATTYQSLKGSSDNQGYITQAQTPELTQDTTQPKGLGSQLQERATTAGTAIQDIGKQLSGQPGDQNWWSDLLHIGGSAAGGLGDIIGAGLELIPGVKQGEEKLGQGISKLADTEVGQSIVSSIQSFSQQHPELSQDLGDVFNIVTAIPILKGLSVVGNVAKSGLATSLKGVVAKGIMKDFEKTTGKKLSEDIASTITKKQIIPEITKDASGKYIWSTKNANLALDSLYEKKSLPETTLNQINKFLGEYDGKPYQPGKISQAIHKGGETIGQGIGGAIGVGVHGVDGGLISGWLGKQGGKLGIKAAEKGTVGLKNLASKKTALPNNKQVLRKGTGLLSGVMAQKASRQDR